MFRTPLFLRPFSFFCVGMENLRRTMNWRLRPTRVKYPFFAFAPQGKIKDKKDTACGRVGTCEMAGW